MLTTRLEVDTMTIKAPQTQVKASLLLSGRISLASRRKRFYFYFINYEIEANTDRINRTYPLYTLKFCRECGPSFKGRNAKTCAFKSAGINAIVLEGLVDLKTGILAQALFCGQVDICKWRQYLHEKRMLTHSLKPWRHPIKLEPGNLVGDNYHHSLDIFPLKSLSVFALRGCTDLTVN